MHLNSTSGGKRVGDVLRASPCAEGIRFAHAIFSPLPCPSPVGRGRNAQSTTYSYLSARCAANPTERWLCPTLPPHRSKAHNLHRAKPYARSFAPRGREAPPPGSPATMWPAGALPARTFLPHRNKLQIPRGEAPAGSSAADPAHFMRRRRPRSGCLGASPPASRKKAPPLRRDFSSYYTVSPRQGGHNTQRDVSRLTPPL